jgi:hypothetical protein
VAGATTSTTAATAMPNTGGGGALLPGLALLALGAAGWIGSRRARPGG